MKKTAVIFRKPVKDLPRLSESAQHATRQLIDDLRVKACEQERFADQCVMMATTYLREARRLELLLDNNND